MAPIIHAHELTRQFGPATVVDHISFGIEPGEIFGFLGPNGAGKTTTIKMLIGMLRPSSGAAFIGGHNLQHAPLQAKALLGYVPDQPNLPEKLTAREFLQFVAGLYRLDPRQAAQRGDELLTMFGLSDRANDLLGEFSHGMRQKMALAGALLHEPQAIFMDEPTVGLDPRSARLIKDILRHLADRGAAVMLTTHILEIAERMCDRVAIINNGRLVAMGTLDQLRHGGDSSLEDIFLELTGGTDYAEMAATLG